VLPGAMIRTLKRKELVNGAHSLRIPGRQPHLSTSLQVVRPIGYLTPQPTHHGSARNLPDGVNASRDCEITRTERDGDRPHVITNHGFAARVRRFHLEYNATSVGQRLETVG
jgi:hypothetical protein